MSNILETDEELNLIKSKYLAGDIPNFFNLNGEIHKAYVVKCYDGDTFYCCFKLSDKFHKFKVRMLGYNSPEMKPSKSDENRDEIIKNAHEAKEKLEEYILDKYVYLYCHDFDAFGRILCDVKLNDTDNKTINTLMLEGGYGVEYVK